MSNLIEYIKNQRAQGLTDYQILQKAQLIENTSKKVNQRGGEGEYTVPNMYDSTENRNFSETHTVLNVGDTLYFPSSIVKSFDPDNIIFVKPSNLESDNADRMAIFFTPNKTYARRFAGINSLNKREVYVHTLKVKEQIKGIRKIDGKLIANETVNVDSNDNLEKRKFATQKYGSSYDGIVSGIEVSLQSNNGNDIVKEYFLCDPERYFTHMATEMQFDATTWVDITNPTPIHIPNEPNK
jgi:hypothetical protein